MGRGRDAAAPARRALAGRLQARDRRRAQGRGGPRPTCRAGSTHPRGGARRERRFRVRRVRSSTFPALLRAQRLCGRAGADDRVPRKRSACSARDRSPTSAAPRMRRSRRRRSAAPHSTRCSARTSSARWKRARRSASRRTTTVRVQEERAGGAEPLLSDEVNEAGQDATAAEALSVRRFGARERLRGAAPLRARGARAPAAPPRLPAHARAARRDFDTRRALARSGAQRRRRDARCAG